MPKGTERGLTPVPPLRVRPWAQGAPSANANASATQRRAAEHARADVVARIRLCAAGPDRRFACAHALLRCSALAAAGAIGFGAAATGVRAAQRLSPFEAATKAAALPTARPTAVCACACQAPSKPPEGWGPTGSAPRAVARAGFVSPRAAPHLPHLPHWRCGCRCRYRDLHTVTHTNAHRYVSRARVVAAGVSTATRKRSAPPPLQAGEGYSPGTTRGAAMGNC